MERRRQQAYPLGEKAPSCTKPHARHPLVAHHSNSQSSLAPHRLCHLHTGASHAPLLSERPVKTGRTDRSILRHPHPAQARPHPARTPTVSRTTSHDPVVHTARGPGHWPCNHHARVQASLRIPTQPLRLAEEWEAMRKLQYHRRTLLCIRHVQRGR